MIDQYQTLPSLNIVSEIELVYVSQVPASRRFQIRKSLDSWWLLKRSWNRKRIQLVEQFKVIYLDTTNHVLAIKKMSTGGITGTVADPRLLLAGALKLKATAMIICHNHPSGNLQPSERDKTLTANLKQASLLMEIKLIDHIILTSEGYMSFADDGLL
ncbi:MAG: JAB domain-containing protein [Bacteroidota bacterium]